MTNPTEYQDPKLTLIMRVMENTEGDSERCPSNVSLAVTEEALKNWERHANYARENNVHILIPTTIDEEQWDLVLDFNTALNDWTIALEREFRIKYGNPGTDYSARVTGQSLWDAIIMVQPSECGIYGADATLVVNSDEDEPCLVIEKQGEETLFEIATESVRFDFKADLIREFKSLSSLHQARVYFYDKTLDNPWVENKP